MILRLTDLWMLSVQMHVCVCIYIYICMYVCMYVCMYTYVHICLLVLYLASYKYFVVYSSVVYCISSYTM